MLRAVLLTSRFKENVNALREEFPRIDEVVVAIKWELAKRPVGEQLPLDPTYRVFLTVPMGHTPPFRVLYNWDPETDPGVVKLIAIAPTTRDFS